MIQKKYEISKIIENLGTIKMGGDLILVDFEGLYPPYLWQILLNAVFTCIHYSYMFNQ